MFEELTLNAPYPFCHANRDPCPRIHFEELAFTTEIAWESVITGGSRNRRCT